MQVENLKNMTKGWFVGNFEPSIYKTNDVEVAVKKYKAGEKEDLHYHKIATEITVVVSGIIKMNGIEYSEGDIIVLNPNEISDFEAVTDAVNTVVKLPGANNDKYIVNKDNI